MKSRLIITMALALMLSGCFIAHRPGGGMEVVPILPVIVEVDMDSHYEYNGYHYFYANDRWYYSNIRNGRRRELPRSRWPREIRRRDADRHNRNGNHN